MDPQDYYKAQKELGIKQSPDALAHFLSYLKRSPILRKAGSKIATNEWLPSIPELFKSTSNEKQLQEIERTLKILMSKRPSQIELPSFMGEAKSLENLGEGATRIKTSWAPPGPARRNPTGTFDSVRFPNNPFIDIDLPSQSHHGISVTADTTEEAIKNITKYQEVARGRGLNPGGSVYMTPGGVHYLEEGFQMTPKAFDKKKLAQAAKSDPFYRSISQMAQKLRVPGPEGRASLGSIPPGFSIRVGPKTNVTGGIREETQAGKKVIDYIKMFLGRMGEGGSDQGERARRIHDSIIKENLQGMEHSYGGQIREGRTVAAEVANNLSPSARNALGISKTSLMKGVKSGVPLLLLAALAGGGGMSHES